jgi:hypothetical protein
LHIFSYRLSMARIGTLAQGIDAVIDENKAYIDDLYNAGRLPLPSHKERSDRFRYGGYAYGERGTSEFHAVASYLDEKRRQVLEDALPNLAKRLFEDFSTDVERFVEKIHETGADEVAINATPVLAFIDAREFVEILLNQSPEGQRLILTGFNLRYENGKLEQNLASEKSWLKEIRRILGERTVGLSAISRYRITSWISDYIDPFLSSGDCKPDQGRVPGERLE